MKKIKSDIEQVVKRFQYVEAAIQRGEKAAIFEIGHRKQRIVLTEEMHKIYQTVCEVYKNTREGWIKRMLGGILRGESDVFLLQCVPCGRNMYYTIKREFIEKVYRCCIAMQMVSYEELMQDEVVV